MLSFAELKTAVQEIIAPNDANTLQNVNNFPVRVSKLIDHKGGHFENIIYLFTYYTSPSFHHRGVGTYHAMKWAKVED